MNTRAMAMVTTGKNRCPSIPMYDTCGILQFEIVL